MIAMSHKFPSLRLAQLLRRLERYGVTWREGKGSEIVLLGTALQTKEFRRYRVGRHTKNRQIPHALLQAVLRRFEIADVDFFEDSIH